MTTYSIQNDELTSSIEFSFREAMMIFIFTIVLGILNAVDLVNLTRAELLFHVHTGTLGWISFSAITILVWYYTMNRQLDETTLRHAKLLLKYIQIVIPTYVFLYYVSYTLAPGAKLFRLFNIGDGGSGFYILVLIGGILMDIGFFGASVFGILQLKQIEHKQTSHFLFLGGIITATYGGIFGVLLEIERFLSFSVFDSAKGQDGLAAHSSPMEAGFLFMLIAGVLEWQLLGEKNEGPTKLALIEVLCFFLAGISLAIGTGFNIALFNMINLPLELAGFIILVIRVFTKINLRSIVSTDHTRYLLPSAMAMTISVLFFLYLVFNLVTSSDPSAFFVAPFTFGLFLANFHSLVIGGTSSALFASISMYLDSKKSLYSRLESVGFILMYIGLIGFMIVLSYRGYVWEYIDSTAYIRTDIASLMGIGLFCIIFTYYMRFTKSVKGS